MAIRSDIIWHDYHIIPDDLPEEFEPVLVTSENVLGERSVRSDVYLKNLGDTLYCWCVKIDGKDEMLWDKVIAWAYLPSPYPI